MVRLQNYEMFWNTDCLINLTEFKSIMKRDIFFNILTFFHAANTCNALEPPRDSPQYDLGYKIRTIYSLLIERWQRFYAPARELSVDETLVPFKGRTKLLQYTPSKPHK